LEDSRSRVVDLAQELADACAGLESAIRRSLPDMPPRVLADVLAVCANDLAQQLLEDPGGVDSNCCAWAVERLRLLRSEL
jgi:hypothetical protein